MKKSLLALGAVAALGGLGFSGAAHAVWVVGDVGAATATQLSAGDNSGAGHILVTPYFSTTNNTGTLLSVVNTDTSNGKAVKVRFRGAANSDDILDFTVLLSPGDVWTASVAQGADGRSTLETPDTSCVLPEIPKTPQPFTTTRLDQKLDAAALAAHTQEGYVEWLNMADIPKNTPLYTAVKHVRTNGVDSAPCTPAVMDYLMKADESMTVAAAASYGLVPPTGGLMGNWTIYNSQNVTSYGGSSTAMVAMDEGNNSATGRLFFAPQIGDNDPTFPALADAAWANGADHYGETADPLLTNNAGGGVGFNPRDGGTPVDLTIGAIPMLPFDLPDLSTPYVAGATAVKQAEDLSLALSAAAVFNEWTAGSDGGVDFSTDWVFSQPTRRYHAVIDYAAAGTYADSKIVRNRNSLVYYTAPQIEAQKHATYGDMLCLKAGVVKYSAYNRDEATVQVQFGGGEWSPGTPAGKQPGFCGEVAVMQFGENRTRALNGMLTPTVIKDASLPTGGAGWMSVALPAPGLPVIGYAANTFNTAVGSMVGNYGDAITHRYKRPARPAVAPIEP